MGGLSVVSLEFASSSDSRSEAATGERQQIPSFIKKDNRAFWFIDCRLKVVNDTSAGGGMLASCSWSKFRARSYMPKSSNKRYKKRAYAFIDAPTWRDFVVEAISTRDSVAKNSEVLVSFDENNRLGHVIDVAMQLLSQSHTMRRDDMHIPNGESYMGTKALDISDAHLVITEAEMHDFCTSAALFTTAPFDYGYGADNE